MNSFMTSEEMKSFERRKLFGDSIEVARELGKRFKPNQIIQWGKETLEVISYPFPESSDEVCVMLREPNDPTTMRAETLWHTIN